MNTIENKSRASKFDRFTIVFLAALGAASFYLYLNERLLIEQLFRGNGEGKIEYVAEVKNLKGNLRYKLKNDLLWMPIDTKDLLENHSEVFASAETNAAIELNDGSKINLGPHTHVLIDLGRNEVKIKLVDGELDIQSNRNVAVALSNGTQIQAGKGKKVNVNFSSRSEVASINSDSGGVKVNHNGENISINGKENLKIKDRALLKFSKDISLIKKLESAAFFFDRYKGEIQFKDDDPNQKKYFLELAADKTFESVAAKVPSKEEDPNLVAFKIGGKFFYRVAAYQDQKLSSVSDSFQLQLVKLPPPRILYPQNEMVIKERETVVTNISKTCPTGTLELEYAPNKDFKKAKLQKVKDGFARAPLYKGTSYLRPKCTLKNGLSAYGQTIAVYKGKKPEVELVPIQLDQNVIELEVKNDQAPSPSILDWIFPKAYAEELGGLIRQKVSWGAVPTATKYKVEISKKRSFKGGKSKISKKPSVEFSFNEDGNYYWRVSYFDKNAQKWSPPSAPGVIRILPAKLKFDNISKDNLRVRDGTLDLSWKSSKLYDNFLISVETPDGKVKDIKVSKDSYSLKMNNSGVHIITLKALKGGKVSASSKTLAVKYFIPKENMLTWVSKPKIKYSTNEKISFSWKHTKKQAPVLINVSKDGKPVFGDNVKKHTQKYEFTPKNGPGSYTIKLLGDNKDVIERIVRVEAPVWEGNKISLKAPLKDVFLSRARSHVTFVWESNAEEPGIMFLRAGKKTYKLKIKPGEKQKKLKIKPKTELEWWVMGQNSRAISSKSKFRVLPEKRTDYELDMKFGVDSRTNSQEFSSDEAEIEGVTGTVSFGSLAVSFNQKKHQIYTGCFPGGSFYYSSSLSSGEDGVSLSNFSAFGAETNCMYKYKDTTMRFGPSMGVESLPYFIQTDDGSLDSGTYQTFMAGGKADYRHTFNKYIDINMKMSAHVGSGLSGYSAGAEALMNYFDWPIIAGVNYKGFSFSSDDLEGYSSAILSSYMGLSIRF